MKVRKTISVDSAPFTHLQKLVKNVSFEINEFIKKRVTELSGKQPYDGSDDYAELKENHTELVSQVARMEKRLGSQAEAFDQANRLLGELGIKPDMSNAGEVIPKFLAAWKGSQEFMHEYITLVEVAKDKKDIERKLSELRRIYFESATEATEDFALSSEQTVTTHDVTAVSDPT